MFPFGIRSGDAAGESDDGRVVRGGRCVEPTALTTKSPAQHASTRSHCIAAPERAVDVMMQGRYPRTRLRTESSKHQLARTDQIPFMVSRIRTVEPPATAPRASSSSQILVCRSMASSMQESGREGGSDEQSC